MNAVLRPRPSASFTLFCLLAVGVGTAASRSTGDELAKPATPSATPTVAVAVPARDAATATTATSASATNSTGAAASPLLMEGSVLAASTGNMGDLTDEVSVRRRNLRGSITNVPVRTVSSSGGALPFVIRERKAVSVLQLFNPFAPASLGTGSGNVFEWHPGEGVNPLPRAFRDERTHEAEGISIIGLPR